MDCSYVATKQIVHNFIQIPRPQFTGLCNLIYLMISGEIILTGHLDLKLSCLKCKALLRRDMIS